MFLFLQYNLTKAKHMQIIFENGNVIQHTRKIYTMYGNLNGQLNYLGQGYVFWYLTISLLSAETKQMF